MMTFHLKSLREEKLGNYNYLSIESMAQEFNKLFCILFRLARLARIKHRRLDSPTQRSAEQLRRELYGSGRGWERTRRIGLLNKFSTDKSLHCKIESEVKSKSWMSAWNVEQKVHNMLLAFPNNTESKRALCSIVKPNWYQFEPVSSSGQHLGHEKGRKFSCEYLNCCVERKQNKMDPSRNVMNVRVAKSVQKFMISHKLWTLRLVAWLEWMVVHVVVDQESEDGWQAATSADLQTGTPEGSGKANKAVHNCHGKSENKLLCHVPQGVRKLSQENGNACGFETQRCCREITLQFAWNGIFDGAFYSCSILCLSSKREFSLRKREESGCCEKRN